MQSEITSPRSDALFTLKLIWGAFVFSAVLYGIILYFLLNASSPSGEFVTQFSQIMQRKDFTISVVIGFVLVTISRMLPKFLFRSRLRKLPNTSKEQVIQSYQPGFLLGLASLEILALLGFVLAYQLHFMPIYWVFGFVATANMLIRFPSWVYIKFLAQESLGKPINF